MVRDIAIVYWSLHGNTKLLAELISQEFKDGGFNTHLFTYKDSFDLSKYDYILFGSYTWDEGKLPVQMRNILKEVLINNPQVNCKTSVFGTGETQWGLENYCRAVDEIEYHLKKNNKLVDFKLKIEQAPLGTYKVVKTKEFVYNIINTF